MYTDKTRLTVLASLVLWNACAGVGIVGLAFPEDFSPPEKAEQPATPPEPLHVELSEHLDDSPASAPPAGDGDTAHTRPEKADPAASIAEAAVEKIDAGVLALPTEIPPLQPVITPETIVFPVPPEAPQIHEPPTSAPPATSEKTSPLPTPAPEKPLPAADNFPAQQNRANAAGTTDSAGAPRSGVTGGVGNSAGNVPGAPERLVYGTGAGRQPAPEYPYQARRRNQTGTVRVRFRTDKDGRVSDAEISEPCEYSALNYAALRTIQTRWRFPAGAPRFYEIEICFKLK